VRGSREVISPMIQSASYVIDAGVVY